MCGFVGYINHSNTSLDYHVLKKMTDLQQHRGPDDQGLVGFKVFSTIDAKPLYADDNEFPDFDSGVGFNRLSILDLSKNGHQPMFSNCGKVVIIYNGETYNAFSYREELLNKGYRLKSRSDTEILLYLYIEYGIDGLLERMNGMFAFTIIDQRYGKVYLARDHFGIKPLYIYESGSSTLFSSEVKSFYGHPEFKAEINTDSLDEYMLFRYCAHDRSLFKNVRQVPPGHYYEFTKEGNNIKEYWSPKLNETREFHYNEALDLLDSTLKESIKSQLISDVKVGCQLSGGIDSSLVTKYAREFFDANMDTFSIVFADEKFSEEKWINYISNHTDSDSHRYQYSSQYASENFFKATWHLDQPISIPNAIGIKRLAERSRENVTVLLSGEGADELFAGYTRYHDLAMRYHNLKKISLLSKFPGIGNRLTRKYQLDQTIEKFFILSSSALSAKEFNRFRPDADISYTIAQRMELFPETGDIIKRASVYDMRTYMVDLLNRQDKMTMAHSMENRVPYLDRNIVDLVLKLPTEFLVRKTNNLQKINSPKSFTKHILKELAIKKFNKEFVYRLKSGFPLPVNDLFYNTPFNEVVQDSILPSIRKRGLFDHSIVQKMWERNSINPYNPDLKNLWMFIAFEAWAQTFLDK